MTSKALASLSHLSKGVIPFRLYMHVPRMVYALVKERKELILSFGDIFERFCIPCIVLINYFLISLPSKTSASTVTTSQGDFFYLWHVGIK